MSWLGSVFVGMLTGALALVCAGVVASAYASWYRVSSFEGASGYLVIGIALLGGFAGLVTGIVVARVVAAGAHPSFLRSLGIAAGLVVAVATLAAGIAWLLADLPPKLGGRELELEVEVRLPAGEATPPAEIAGEAYLSLGATSGGRVRLSLRGELALPAARLEQGRWIVPGAVHIFTTRGDRVLDVVLGGESRAGFLVPLPGRPGEAHERWSDWLPHPRQGQPPWPDSKCSYRFRVRRIEPPPPEPSQEEIAARELAALTPDSPLADWLRFAQWNQPDERVAAAMAVISARQVELAQAIARGGAECGAALVGVERLTAVSPEVAEAVLAEGRAIAADIRQRNTLPAGAGESPDGQSDLRSRFSSWRRAWWTVHRRTGVDGSPPVQEILDLATVRAADPVMDEIIVNARAHLEGLTKAEGAAQ